MKIRKSELKEIIREVLEEKNWIKGAIKKPGALRKSMGAKKGEGDKKLSKADSTELKRLNLAKTLRKMK